MADITAEILSRLPAHLAHVAEAIRARFGRPIHFLHVNHLPGNALARAQVVEWQPTVLLTIGLDTPEEVVAEELLHLQRWADGHPGVQEGVSGNIQQYSLACVLLSGLIDEYAFAPQLQAWGYDRTSGIEQILQRYLTRLESVYLPLARHPTDPESLEHSWVCSFAIEYARAVLLLGPTATREAFLAAYNHPQLRPAREAGEQIAVAIRENPDQTPTGTAGLIDTCLRGILNVPDGAYSIRYPC